MKIITHSRFAEIESAYINELRKNTEVLKTRYKNGIAFKFVSFSGLLIVYLHNAHCEFIFIMALRPYCCL